MYVTLLNINVHLNRNFLALNQCGGRCGS